MQYDNFPVYLQRRLRSEGACVTPIRGSSNTLSWSEKYVCSREYTSERCYTYTLWKCSSRSFQGAEYKMIWASSSAHKSGYALPNRRKQFSNRISQYSHPAIKVLVCITIITHAFQSGDRQIRISTASLWTMSFSAFHTAYLVYMYVLTTPSNVESVDTWPSLHGLVRTHSTLHHYKI